MTIDEAIQTAMAHHQAGHHAQAESIYRQVLAQQPQHPQAWHLLGVLAFQNGRNDLAVEWIGKAISLNPSDADYHNNLGLALAGSGRFSEAINSYQTALSLQPNMPGAYFNLANALREVDRIDDSIVAYQRAIQLNANYPEAHNNLGNVLKQQGLIEESVQCYRRALLIKPDFLNADSNLIYSMHFAPSCTMHDIAREQRRWNQLHAAPLKSAIRPHTNDRNPDRKLRIGYVSPDFYQQAEAFFVMPLFQKHDRARFEVHHYASVRRPDDVTTRFTEVADVWHDVLGLSDEALAEKIHEDRIDILIDLTMHMRNNRLFLFARKPSPVQFTWLAYPGSTGLETIDYRLTDPRIDPPDVDTSWSSEEPVRLADCWCCFDPITEFPSVNELPAERNGSVTFGCFNNFAKINDSVLRLWAGVLNAVPGSKLLLLSAQGQHRARVQRVFSNHGVSPERIEFVSPLPRVEYLALYHRIDVALDPFPYNGITTTCDAIWMGVPVLTVQGKTPPSRAGLSLLSTIGVPELVANSDTHFIQLATELANDLPRLKELRRTLRSRMQSSPLMDAARFTGHVENAYRNAWRKWCAT